jgi:hypothetical protein
MLRSLQKQEITLRAETQPKHNVPHLKGILQLLGIAKLQVVQSINL